MSAWIVSIRYSLKLDYIRTRRTYTIHTIMGDGKRGHTKLAPHTTSNSTHAAHTTTNFPMRFSREFTSSLTRKHAYSQNFRLNNQATGLRQHDIYVFLLLLWFLLFMLLLLLLPHDVVMLWSACYDGLVSISSMMYFISIWDETKLITHTHIQKNKNKKLKEKKTLPTLRTHTKRNAEFG